MDAGEATELRTLAELGIAALNTQKTVNNTLLWNGTVIADLGTYTRTDGSLGTAGQTSRLGDVNFSTNMTIRQIGTKVPLQVQQKSDKANRNFHLAA